MRESPQRLPNLQHAQQLAKKIQLLKQNVYPKKKKLTIKSNSVKILPSSKIIPKINLIKASGQQNIQPQDQQNILEERSTQNLLKKTNLEFESKKFSSSQDVPPWTVQNWLPGSIFQKKKRIIEKQQENKPLIYYSRSELSQRKHQHRDAQSLLRKNSLFLLNFLTTKERKTVNSPHIGNFPLVFNKIQRVGSSQNKTQALKLIIKKDLEQIEKIQKQRNRPWRQYKIPERNRQVNSFQPQPW